MGDLLAKSYKMLENQLVLNIVVSLHSLIQMVTAFEK